MAVYDFVAEVKALHTVLTPESAYCGKVYNELTAEYFHDPSCKIIFQRLKSMMEIIGKDSSDLILPSLDFVLSDSEIPDVVRASFLEATTTCPIVKTKADFQILTSILGAKAAARRLARASKDAFNSITGSEKPEDDIASIKTSLEKELARTNDNLFGDNCLQIGADYSQTTENVFRDIYSGQVAANSIKTGFKEFDEATGGFERTNLVLISANSGGGKSMLALNIMVRQYLMGYDVVLVSFEMSYPELLIRILSMISEVEMAKIRKASWTIEEKIRVDAAWREFILAGKKKGNNFTILYTATAKLHDIKAWVFRRDLKPDVLIIDYLNFLSSSESETAQWQQLVDITGDCKRLAGQLNCVLFLLAQLDDDFKLKYAKGIKDHANYLWGWVRDEKAISDRLILVKQMKSRQTAPFDFTLFERFDICQFRDMDQADRMEWPDPNALIDEYDSHQLIRMSTAMMEEDIKEAEARKVIDAVYVKEEPLLLTAEEEVSPILIAEYKIDNYETLEVKSRKRPLIATNKNEDFD